ncbi:response regulator [Thomasclavelia sp.]
MNILVVEDEKLVLNSLVEELEKVFSGEKIMGVQTVTGALRYLDQILESNEIIAYAFLDIRLRGMLGLELGKRIKEKSARTKIVFCTAYSEYACDAYKMHAIGYLLKPIFAADIIETLKAMDKDWINEDSELSQDIRVQTFGNFEIFINGKPIKFDREKAKELLAYLVDRRGSSISMGELSAILWEDKPLDRSTMGQTRVVVSSLRKTLKESGIDDLLIKTWNHLAIDSSKIKCDLYDFLEGDILAINSYSGEYMKNYSWAEFTNASLSNKWTETVI